jgi:hypothetical protein
MTTTPEPTDKLDAAAQVVVNGPEDDPLRAEWIVRLVPPDLTGLLEPDAGRLARPVPRGAGHRKVSGLPDVRDSRPVLAHDRLVGRVASGPRRRRRRLRCPFQAPTIRCDALLLCQDEGRYRRIRVGGGGAFVPRSLLRSNRMPLWIRRCLK